MSNSGVNGRIVRLEERTRPATADNDEHLAIALRGFDDVHGWLEERGPAPDVHRVADLVRVPFEAGVKPGDVEYFELLACLVLSCAARRCQDVIGGAEPDEETLDRFIDADPISTTWVNNALWALEHAETVRAGGKSSFIGGMLVFPLTPWCGPDCPKQGWAGPERYPEWWQACLDFGEKYGQTT